MKVSPKFKLPLFSICLVLTLTNLFANQEQNQQSGYPVDFSFIEDGLGDIQDQEDLSQVTVKLKNQNTELKCFSEKKHHFYHCQNGSVKYFIRNSGFGMNAFSFDQKSKQLAPIIVEEMYTNQKIIYHQMPPMNGFGSNGNAQAITPISSSALQANSELQFLEMSVEAMLSMNSGRDPNPENPELENSIKKIKELVVQKKAILKSAMDSKDFELELETGEKVTCQRNYKEKELTGEWKSFADQIEQMSGKKLQCGFLECAPLKLNGKSYRPFAMIDTVPNAGLRGDINLITSDNQLGPSVKVKKVISKKNNVTLVDNTFILEALKNAPANYISDMQNQLVETLPKSLHSKKDQILKLKDPNYEMFVRLNEEVCAEPRPLYSSLQEAKKAFLTELANADVAQFVSVLQNGALAGSFVGKEYAAKKGCVYEGIFVDLESVQHLEKIKKNIHPDKMVQTISLDRANELFKKATNMKDIAWNYKLDGCYARAHLMARRFEEEGVRVDKVWIKGDLTVKDNNPPISWNFHVAPIVYVEDKGIIQKMVIDPSLFDRPVTVAEWDKKMSKNTINGSVETAFPFPENSAFFERSTLSYSSSDPYLPLDQIQMTEQEKMRKANSTMFEYKKLETK